MQVATLTEETYLQNLVDNGESVSCFLANGIRLQGSIRSHHGEAIFLEPPANSRGGLILIFKLQISSIMPTSNGATKFSVKNNARETSRTMP